MRELFIAFSTLFAIVDPITLVAPFLAVTTNESTETRARTAWRAVAISYVVMVGCAIAGQTLLTALGITLPAFQIAGGILLFFVAFDMIYARPHRTQRTEEEEAEGAQKEDVAVFPLAIPLLAGPGTIASVLMLASRAHSASSQVMLFAAITLTMACSLLILRAAERVRRLLGQIGINTLSRLMGIVLSALAVQFVISALAQVWASRPV